MIMNRPYFYKDSSGETRRFHYCSFCGAGPFREEDIHRGEFFIDGSRRQARCICYKCDLIKNPKRNRNPSKPESPIVFSDVITADTARTGQVRVGQVWHDDDKRRDRTVKLDRVAGENAYYTSNGREIRISVKRLQSRWTLQK